MEEEQVKMGGRLDEGEQERFNCTKEVVKGWIKMYEHVTLGGGLGGNGREKG